MAASDGNPKIPYGPQQRPWDELVPEYAARTVRAPSEDPIAAYPPVPPEGVNADVVRIDYKQFEIPPNGLTLTQREAALASLRKFADVQHAHFMGFQANEDEAYSERLSWLLNMHTNNIGDPYSTGAFTLNTKFCERAVIDYFAALWNVDWPHNPSEREALDRVWGYVLTMGFTEGNIYGVFNARDYLRGRLLLDDPQTREKTAEALKAGREAPLKRFQLAWPKNAEDPRYQPVAFYSQDVHYSVIKACRLLDVPSFFEMGTQLYPGECPLNKAGRWPEEVPSHDYDHDNPLSGTINLEALEALLRFFAGKGHPLLIVANIGTTWKGAYDDVEGINDMLVRLGEDYPWLWERTVEYESGETDTRRGFWLHIDGALGAAYLPFVEMAYEQKKIEHRGPIFDFRNPAVMSVGCSMHKWIGGPWPSGVFLTRKRYQLQPPDDPGFLGSLDTTLGGSRSGFSPVILWDYWSRTGYEKNVQKAIDTEGNSAYLEQQLNELQDWLGKKYEDAPDLWVARSRLALTVRFRQVNASLVYKWTLDTDTLFVPTSKTEQQQRSYAHVFLMESVTRERIDAFIKDVRDAATEDWRCAFPTQISGEPNPGPVEPIDAETPAGQGTPVPVIGRGLGSAARK